MRGAGCDGGLPPAPAALQEGKRAKRAAQEAGGDVAAPLKDAAGAATYTASKAGDAVQGAASEATAQAARVFLAQGGETQAGAVPPEVAEANAARIAGAASKED